MGVLSKIDLHEGEKVVEIIRPSALKFFGHYFLAIILISAASFCSFWLINQDWYGVAGLGACFIAAIALFISAARKRNKNFWILTSDRLIDFERSGMFKYLTGEIEFDEMGEVKVWRGKSDLIFNLGKITVDSPDMEIELSLAGVAKPKNVAGFIADYVNERGRQNDSKSAMNTFFEILPRLTESELIEARNRLDNRIDALNRIG